MLKVVKAVLGNSPLSTHLLYLDTVGHIKLQLNFRWADKGVSAVVGRQLMWGDIQPKRIKEVRSGKEGN